MRWVTGLLWIGGLFAQRSLYLIYFTEKPDSLLLYPERYLSPIALERRRLQSVPITLSDMPIPDEWLQKLSAYGAVWGVSRWLNAALVELKEEQPLPALPFISCIEPFSRVRHASRGSLAGLYPGTKNGNGITHINRVQLEQLHLHTLHSLGYKGQGIRIAILDAGFPFMNQLPEFQPLFQNGRYLGGYDFVDRDSSIFEDNPHGTQVASVIVGEDPETGYIGGAPEAHVLLARTENALSESRLEEWNWMQAAEWADSLGIYIIQSSLGYSTFDDPAENYTYADMNGHTALSSRAAALAAQKGMLVVTSAGNEGSSSWRYITAPADADSIVAVGAINSSGEVAPFSSRGPTSDGRYKPDVVALGWGTYIIGLSGEVQQASGTSFSAPLITSLAACLWQSKPSLPGWHIREALLRSADRASAPDNTYGYGIPHAEKALKILQALKPSSAPILQLYPNPASSHLTLFLADGELGWYNLEVYDTNGRSVFRSVYRGMTEISIPIQAWNKGAYFVQLIPYQGDRYFDGIFVKI
ncbi:MAG: S8 family serine peptidase [Bacteroidia bacterium]|nr:S8 family serine peptidase [Bacteroidia bacterium]MDW8016075.1 S8 family serine peptidase [Bacteroidia bacterium]